MNNMRQGMTEERNLGARDVEVGKLGTTQIPKVKGHENGEVATQIDHNFYSLAYPLLQHKNQMLRSSAPSLRS